MTDVAVFWTIAFATLAWAFAECCRLSATRMRLARRVWTAGAVAMLIHSVTAFAVFYQGRQSIALAETARQTAAITGVDSGAGLYVNYAFVAIWIADALRWWTVPADRAGRFGRLGWLRLAFFLFMFVNGAVIFADGWMSLVGTVSVAAVATSASLRIWRFNDR
jgi:hypothetical protein